VPRGPFLVETLLGFLVLLRATRAASEFIAGAPVADLPAPDVLVGLAASDETFAGVFEALEPGGERFVAGGAGPDDFAGRGA
jgi:hypothetical protein